MCLALRYLATGANYSVIGDTQGVHKSTVCRAVHEVVNFFCANQESFIKWPANFSERCRISGDFYELYGKVPGVLGCIDIDRHHWAKRPKGNQRGFLNRKGYHSLNVMVATMFSHKLTKCPKICSRVAGVWATHCSRRHQPPPVVARGEKMSAARQRLVDQFFGPDASVRKRVLITEMKELYERLKGQKQRQRRRAQAQRRRRRD